MFGLWALLIAENPAAQTTYPDKAIRVIVGFPPGSQPDTVARLLGQKFAETMGKPVVVENIAGAAGNIGAERVAKAAPDGYTLGLLNQPQVVINPNLYKLAHDPVKDFTPISQLVVSSMLLVVHNAVPAKSIKDLVALTRAQPGEFTFASGGSGSNTHMAAELFKSVASVDIRHIPYKGATAAIPDLIGGRVSMMFGPTAAGLPLVREGKLRALAVTSLKRSSAIPDVQTIAESGYPGFEFTLWLGLLAPARPPATIVSKLHLETVKALALPDLRVKLTDLGLETIGNSPNAFVAIIKSEISKWAKVIKDAGIKTD
jgi:tripartite-type tricarboxylate transporter receptor subunit TctC